MPDVNNFLYIYYGQTFHKSVKRLNLQKLVTQELVEVDLLYLFFLLESILSAVVYYLQESQLNALFFISNAVFSTQPKRCLNLSWFVLQMLFSCWLTHVSIIILRHILYLVYFCPYQVYLYRAYVIFFHFPISFLLSLRLCLQWY